MAILGRSATRRIDEYWDNVGHGISADSAGIDPTLVETIHRLSVSSEQAVPLAAYPRVWRSVMAPAGAMPATSGVAQRRPTGRHAILPLRLPGRQLLGEWPTIALMLLMLVGGMFAFSIGRPSPSGQSTVPVSLYLVDQGSGSARPIDPASLSDLTGSATIALGTPEWQTSVAGPVVMPLYREWVVSADGSTVVGIVYDANQRNRREVSVRDGIDGLERSRFQPTGEIGFQIPVGAIATSMLSADGGRLVLASELPASDETAGAEGVEWAVYDTDDGRPLATIQSFEPGALDLSYLAEIDPAANRLFSLAYVSGQGAQARPLQLVVYDLTTGLEIGQLDLPGVLAGEWNSDGTEPSRPPGADSYLVPGFAVSPDGRQLAFLPDTGTQVTLVDAERLVIERTVRISTPLKENRGLPSVAPDPGAWPTVVMGTSWRVVYAAGGTDLLVTGGEHFREQTGRQAFASFGLQRVELATGRVVARSSLHTLGQVWPTVDGKSIYALAYSTPWYEEGGVEAVLHRLEPLTLDSVAERPLAADDRVVLWPRIPTQLSIAFYHQP